MTLNLISSDILAPVLYMILQGLVTVPLLNVGYQYLSTFQLILMFLSTSLAVVMYCKVAFTNPGYIKGNEADVEKRAGAYNPKHY